MDGVHDVSEGGLGVALAEMAVRSQLGFRVGGLADHAALFGEGPSRVVLCVPDRALATVQARVEAASVGWTLLGRAGGDRLVVEGLLDVPVGRRRGRLARRPAHAMGMAVVAEAAADART